MTPKVPVIVVAPPMVIDDVANETVGEVTSVPPGAVIVAEPPLSTVIFEYPLTPA